MYPVLSVPAPLTFRLLSVGKLCTDGNGGRIPERTVYPAPGVDRSRSKPLKYADIICEGDRFVKGFCAFSHFFGKNAAQQQSHTAYGRAFIALGYKY